MMNKTWLAYANRSLCHHAEALNDLGFINWTMHRTNFSIGDIVYLFVSDERRVRFKTQVVEEGCKRQDNAYWPQIKASNHLTYKLELVEEYAGHELDEELLKKHGFNGGRSIEHPMSNNPLLFKYIDGIFAHNGYGYIIDEVVPQPASREHVRRIIPILIRWAKQGLTNMTYKNIINELGMTTFSGIGKQLGYVDDVIKKLIDVTGEKDIPTLNALVKNQSTGLPSTGFSYVYDTYDKMTDDEKHIFVEGLNKKAIEFPHWDWVLSALNLRPSKIDIAASEKTIRTGKFYAPGGEGEAHKKLKENIYNKPETIGIRNVAYKEMEHILLSGDRLDVYFELKDGSKVAVEIKPSTSPDADILRGLFQCVKYKCILDAEDKIHGQKSKNSVMLVMGGELSPENRIVRETLGVTIVEDVKTL